MMSKRSPLIVIFLLLSLGCAAAQPAEIIELRNRTADEMIPVIRPLLKPGDALTGTDYQLIIRTDSQNLASIRNFIARLDKAPAQLLISVKNTGQSGRIGNTVNIGGTLGNGNRRIIINNSGELESIHIQAGRAESTDKRQQSPQIRVTEGRPALIYTGVSIPVKTRQQLRQGNHILEQERIEYRNVESGLYVTARLTQENEVILEIEPQRQSLGTSGSVNTFGLSTTLRGRLGEWIPLGGVTENRTTHSNRPGGAGSTRVESGDNVMIKVEKIEN